MLMIISFNVVEYVLIGVGILKMFIFEYDSEFCYDF